MFFGRMLIVITGPIVAPDKDGGVHMRKVMTIATAVTMTSLFAVMFWAQIGIATNAAIARSKADYSYGVTSTPYLPFQVLDPVY
jgi:hypothetical protein